MAQFDIYKNLSQNSATFPYLLDVTHEVNYTSKLRVVAPLCSDSDSVSHINPVFEIFGQKVYMSTMDIAGVSVGTLGESIGNLDKHRTQIIDALDFLINGF
jgi:toxin CcdB